MTKAMLSLKNHARELCNILRQDCEKIAEFFATMIKSRFLLLKTGIEKREYLLSNPSLCRYFIP